MLVLSRRVHEKVVFENLGVTFEVLKIAGNVVRLGITAPDDIRILREELAGQSTAGQALKPRKPLSHAVRNRLNSVSLALGMAQRHLDRGRIGEAEQVIEQLLCQLEAIDQEAARAAESQHPAGCRALLVEDNANECQLLAGYLRSFDYDVATAGDGLAALDYLESQPEPDVVLLDMQMPRLDGPATIQRIRSNPRLSHLKLFVISGSQPADYNLEIGPRGVDHWFSKPLDPRRLVSALSSACPQHVN
jgi:carbon storage regulator CsrA